MNILFGMTEGVNTMERTFISLELKNELEQIGFLISETPDTGVMWGFDGSTKYFPRETYVKESIDGKPKLKLRIEKTNVGIILIINSIPFKPHNHLDRAELSPKDIIPIVKDYMNLIQP